MELPLRNGKLLVWDATSPDTFPPSYVSRASSKAVAVAALTEDRKRTKYTCLEPSYTFTPIAIETSGIFGPLTLQFLKDLGNRLRQFTSDNNLPYPEAVCVSAERKSSISPGNTLILITFVNIIVHSNELLALHFSIYHRLQGKGAHKQ